MARAVFGYFALNSAVHPRDRKSTRLNSSHLVISYAVFCLKKNNDNYRWLIEFTQKSRAIKQFTIALRSRSTPAAYTPFLSLISLIVLRSGFFMHLLRTNFAV